MPTINDYINNTNGLGEKPATPIEGGSEPIFTPGGQDVIEGPTTRPIGEPSSGAVDKEGNVIDTTGRVGDYVYSNGRAYVVPNSMTDLYQRYGVVRGGTKLQDLKFTDYVNAAMSGLGARLGLPTDTSNAATTLGTGFASRLLSAIPVVRDIWGIANAMSSLEASKKAYLDYWMNQDVEYDIALDFSTDKNGNQIAKINYEKMKDAGPGSGIAIREATNAENSDALMNGDNSLSVNVSESFANSDVYKDTLAQIKEAYPSLSVDEANTVINEETGATVLDTIKKFILAQEAQYYYNAKSIYDFKQIAPNASQESLEKATYTQLMGAMDENSLKEMTVTIYNEQNEMEEKNAEEYLNSIKDLDDRGRENYMVSIGNRVKSDDISDDEKVVLQAQANALYMASNNDGPYKDMYRKDFWDSIADTGTLLLGIRSGNLFGIDELTTFEDNELFRGGIDLVTGLARLKIQSSVMNKIEGLERLGAQNLGGIIGDNALGRFMQNINTFAPQDTPIKVTDIGKALPSGGTLTAGGFLGRTLTQQGAQMAADVAFDLGKMGAYTIAGEDYDFWGELGTDFFIDALMTYGPSAYIESMTAPKYERKRFGLEIDDYKKDTLDDISKRMEDDEFFDGKYQGPTGAGLYEVKFVELTADELAKRRAEKLDKLTDSKIGLKVQELFFDRNAAMGKLAAQIRSVVGGDNYYFRKMLRYSGDIRQLTKDVMSEYKMRDTAKTALSNLGARIQEIAPKAKDFTKADADYVNAIANRTRFLEEWKGDKDAERAINKFYEKAVNGVSAERAEQLNGLVGAMRQVAADGIDFYGERGILSKKQIRELRKNPVYKDGIYLPVWTKAGRSLDGDISQGRAKIKSVFDPKVLISLDDLENPIVTIASYLNNIARNVAINDRAMAIREAANIAGVKIHILDDTSGVLSEVTNLRELNADFEKKYQKIVKEVKKAVPTRKQWQEINNKLILDSAVMKGASELERLKDKEKNLRKELRDEKKAQDDIRANAVYAPEAIQNAIGNLSKLSAGKISDSELKSNIRTIPATENMLARLPKNSTAHRRLSRALDKAKTNLKNNGYKVGDFAYVGRKYNDGMNVDVIAKDVPSGYNGQLYIKEVFRPDVDKDGKAFVRAQVIVGDQPKKPEVPNFGDGAEEMALRIIKTQERIDANKQAQLRQMDNIKSDAQRLMEEAQAINKASPVKLDIQSYADVQLTNELKQAFRSNTPTGEIQAILNKAVEEANPYVSRSSVIAREAGEAARKFRKRVYRDMKVKENVYGKKASDKVNDLVDKVTDHIVTKVTGEQKTLTAIDDNELTRILNNNDDPHTIRYMMDGTEHKMVLTGKGSEELVQEFYAPEYKATNGVRRILRFGNSIAQAKRYLTTSADPTRVLPNLARDWSRGIVTTGGEILLSPDQLRTDAIERGDYTPEQIEKIDNGFRLANEAIDESTFTASMQQPRKNRKKSMIRAMNAPTDGNAFVRFIYDRTESAGKFFSTLQDMGESFTRRRAMANAYYKELASATARGLSIDEAVKRATAAAYFYGREATVNFFRRGKLISEVAQMVPYLSQNFASLESFKYAYLDNPIAVTRSLKATVSTYATLIALALSNDESRKRYFLLTEYDRAHNIIIPLTNDLIVTVPLDENVAAFLTPYRRMIETLNGVDPEAFYLWASEGLMALSPLDLSGFSEGDKFNVVRGFEKIGSQVIPTWAQPILESMTGTDWFYGTDISVDEDYVGARTGNWNPTPGELTTKSKNSEILSHVANATGIPQWIVQNIYSEYGGNVGQYFLNTLDKLTGATEEAQGGKEFFDSIFKPMTGAESDEANNAFWTGVSRLNEEKAALQRELKTIKDKTEAATGEAKAELQKKRQEKIKEFGTRVSDFLTQYLSAFEITGGLTKSQANRIWRLYDIYDQDDNEQLYRSGSPEEYFDKQADKQANKETTNLAGLSGLDKFYHTPIDDYHRTYAEQMFRNTIYGSGTQSMVDIANILEDTSDYENSFTKLRSDAIEARKKARTEEDWDNYDKIAYQYDYKVLSALYPYLLEHGIADTLNNNAVIKYLDEWILIPSEEMRTSKGRYVPNLGVDSEKHKAFTKQFIKRMYGVSGE